jgi:hypothetical protein
MKDVIHVQTIDKMSRHFEVKRYYSSVHTAEESIGISSVTSSSSAILKPEIEQIKMIAANEDRYEPGDVVGGY